MLLDDHLLCFGIKSRRDVLQVSYSPIDAAQQTQSKTTRKFSGTDCALLVARKDPDKCADMSAVNFMYRWEKGKTKISSKTRVRIARATLTLWL